jgi:hypothetical protein
VLGLPVERHVADGKTPYVAAWAIQLACEDGRVDSPTLRLMADLAKSSASPVVRLYLTSAAQRLPAEQRWEIVAGLLTHDEDAEDHNLPLMYWYALEPLVAADPTRGAGDGAGDENS